LPFDFGALRMSAPLKVIIDTDPGIDDAVAILFALGHGGFDVRAITTVAGNLGIRTTTRNALRLLALMGRADVPVVAGAAKPLRRDVSDSADIHGRDGLGGVSLPEPAMSAQDGDAVAFLAGVLDDMPGEVDVLALGPLTNIARLIEEHPASAMRMRRLIAMGGAVHEPGNVGPRAEFNIACDPEAAAIVFASGLPLTLIPLDATRKVRATRDHTRTLRASGVPAAMASADLIDAYFVATAAQSQMAGSRPLHDPCVMLHALDPALFHCERLAFAVDAGLPPDAGAMTIMPGGPTIEAALGVDTPAALALLMGGLMRQPESAA
jgi:purine nucleosidase/pyrimidine-specific ribonucleoside hydrolase